MRSNYTRAAPGNLIPAGTMADNSLNTHRLCPRAASHAGPRRALVAVALTCLALAQGAPDARAVTRNPSTQQLEFGVKVALKGSWNEAAFRFQRAIKLGGSGPHVFNNLAVAQESLGQFEQARESYEKALSLEKTGSGDPRIRENYERLLNFLKSSHPAPAAP